MTGESLHFRRGAIAGFILVLHGLAFLALTLSRRSERQDATEPAPITLTWIETLRTDVVMNNEPPLAAQPPKMLVPSFRGAITSLPDLSAAPALADPNLAVLRDYVACGVNSKDRLWTEDRERCRSLQNHPVEVAEHKPTDEETAKQRAFDKAKARQDAPLKLPCVAAFVVNPVCVILGLVNGFELDQ